MRKFAVTLGNNSVIKVKETTACNWVVYLQDKHGNCHPTVVTLDNRGIADIMAVAKTMTKILDAWVPKPIWGGWPLLMGIGYGALLAIIVWLVAA